MSDERTLALLEEQNALLRAIASRPGGVAVVPVEGEAPPTAPATKPLLSPLEGKPEGLFGSPVYKLLFQALRNAQADYKTEVTFIEYVPDVKQKLLEFRAEEDSYLLLMGLKFNYILLKNFYAVFQIYVNDEPLMNPDGYKVLSPFSIIDKVPFLKVIDPGSRVEVYVTLKAFDADLIPDFFALLDAAMATTGGTLGEDLNTYILVQSGILGTPTEWFSNEVTFKDLGQYTVHVEADLVGGNSYDAHVFWEWLEPSNLAPVELPLDQSPIILNVPQKNTRGRLHYVVNLIDTGDPNNPAEPPQVNDIRLIQTYAKKSLDWGNLTVVNTIVRGVKLPRDVFQSFGEAF